MIRGALQTYGLPTGVASQASAILERLDPLSWPYAIFGMLDHATPAMTMRYARHAPEAYFTADAARIAASLSGGNDREAEAVRQAVIHRADSA